ncbi:sensor domain-containing diguanylate cyclase [Gellertiella hungarica]|uniref:diguanylate cyclase n=1 Tax=Gellertiella hungarica TaxID=1572859 RepID=A0A7W6NM67_9HYPH|nr:sensor domain-containing diguanylate cyclase [Gellertiella hungarica]MBB4066638.1 diguanylate cyclase (GGDEF)-like protein [Gellertiella hungarica]
MTPNTPFETVRTRIIGGQGDTDIDALTVLATAVTGKPYALVSVLDGPIRWSKAECGISVPPAPRELSFCSACVEAGEILIVDDAASDPRFASLPAVSGRAGIRFYAGLPLHVKVGNIEFDATLCVLDSAPGRLEEGQLDHLKRLGALLRFLLIAKLAAATDHVTGLWNKRTFDETMKAMLAVSRRTGTAVHLCLLDVDHFKTINDSYGHDSGDRVLQSLATLLTSACPADSVLCRLGGDEFAVLYATGGRDAATEFFRKLPSKLQYRLHEGPVVSVTAGHAYFTEDMAGAAPLFKAADMALYEAKRRQRGTSCSFRDLAA